MYQQGHSRSSNMYCEVRRDWPSTTDQQSLRNANQQKQQLPTAKAAYSAMQRWLEETTREQPYNDVGAVKGTSCEGGNGADWAHNRATETLIGPHDCLNDQHGQPF